MSDYFVNYKFMLAEIINIEHKGVALLMFNLYSLLYTNWRILKIIGVLYFFPELV